VIVCCIGCQTSPDSSGKGKAEAEAEAEEIVGNDDGND